MGSKKRLPQMAGGSASALSLSRPAQASLTLRPVGLLSRLKRPLSRGSSPSGRPAEPLVSFQINRQLSGWNFPPLMIRAFGAHGHNRTGPGSADVPSGNRMFCSIHVDKRSRGGGMRKRSARDRTSVMVAMW